MKQLVWFAMFMMFTGCATDDNEGDCSGSVLGCAWAELSSRQEMEACDLISASIEATAGTKYECMSGENAGLYLTVESSATCASHSYPADCAVTVQQTLDCFKAAKVDPCAAFADNAACDRLLSAAATCQ